ncbi:MAG TPA: SRPBCC family protein [Candidatus Dormibacteraeota bacterium]
MIDIVNQISAIHREVGSRTTDDGEAMGVLLRRTYDAPIEDVWDAMTDPERIRRWFLPVSGDLRAGGEFQLEGHAGGRILRCEPPRLLRVTFGGESSLVELRLSPDGEDATSLELEHTVPLELARSAAGALYVGPGWDGAMMAMGRFLAGEVLADPVAAANSMEGQEFSRQSVHAWTAVVEASGAASAEDVAAAVQVALAQFAPDVRPEP